MSLTSHKIDFNLPPTRETHNLDTMATTKLESLVDEVQSLSTKNGIQEGLIGELQKIVVEQETTIVRHEVTIGQLNNRISVLSTDNESLNSRISVLSTDNESLNSKVAGLTTDKNMQSALLMMHDLVALYRFYFFPDTPRWSDIIKQAMDAQGKLDDDEMSADDFEIARVALNSSLGLDDVDVFDLIHVSKMRNGMAHEDVGSAKNQKAFLEKCASVTDFPEMFDDLCTKLLQRLSKVTLTRKM